MRSKRQSIILLFVLLITSRAGAEIYHCDGVWTNKACPGKSSAVMEESPIRTVDPKSTDLKKRNSWMHDLDMLRLKAKTEFEIEVRVDGVRDLCSQEETSLIDCNKIISEKEFEINQLILEARKSKNLSAKGETDSKIENNTTVVQKESLVVVGRPSGPRHFQQEEPKRSVAPSAGSSDQKANRSIEAPRTQSSLSSESRSESHEPRAPSKHSQWGRWP